jgi:hypothetical protein
VHDLTLHNLGSGALEERFADELSKLLENVFDPNTPWNAKRAIAVRVVFLPNEDRDQVKIDFSVESRLSPAKVCLTEARIGVGPNGPVIREMVQQPLFPPSEESSKKVVKMPANGTKEV